MTPGDTYFGYFDNTSSEGFRKAIDAFDAYILDEGPFDGVIAFSPGALLTSTLLARKEKDQKDSSKAKLDGMPFQVCSFFLWRRARCLRCAAWRRDPCDGVGGRMRNHFNPNGTCVGLSRHPLAWESAGVE